MCVNGRNGGVASKKKGYIIGCLALLLLWVAVHLLQSPHKIKKPVVSVTASTVMTKAMPLLLEFPAQIDPLQSVEIRPQVSGVLQKIDFMPGQNVTAGQLLFEIVPDPFALALEQAQSTLAGNEAQLTNYRANEARAKTLIKGGYISQQDYMTIKAQFQMQQALVQVNQEKIKNAQLQLNYTKITAPIEGKTGNVVLKMGDYITTESTATPLVTINKIDPVYITFNLPQTELRSVLHYNKISPLTVEAWSEDGKQKLGQGTLAFIDNAINTTTGTILLKGLIPNKNHLLWPSQLVMVKLILYVDQNALVIPSAAVKSDDQGNFVYKIQSGRGNICRVTVYWQSANLSVIKSGLQVGDQVIKSVPPNFRNGQRIMVYAHQHQ